MDPVKKEYRTGMAAALACAVLWGFLPIYWQALRPIESSVIIFYRIALVGVVCFVMALALYGWKGIAKPLAQKGAWRKFFLAGILITLNWSLYIWAVNADLVIQTCIGYYIEPLVVSLLGVILFRERLTFYKKTALILAGIGVLVIIVHFGEAPVVALTLAVSFACYAALKKTFKVEAILSLLYETALLVPVSLAVIVWQEVRGQGALAQGAPWQVGLLLLAGVLTAVPLGLFASAAKRIPLVTLGLTEYISPSITLVIGIFMFREPFDLFQLIAFIIIWVGLGFFTVGEIKQTTQAKG